MTKIQDLPIYQVNLVLCPRTGGLVTIAQCHTCEFINEFSGPSVLCKFDKTKS